MRTQEIYETYGGKLFFFILKRVKDQEVANDILQNSFLKIHKNLNRLKDGKKVKAWVYQIARNEIANHFNRLKKLENIRMPVRLLENESVLNNCCCFDRFINQLPLSYKLVIEKVYIEGQKQEQVAKSLGLSLANIKARIRKSKALLKEQFVSCCNYQINTKGKLVGEADCAHCQ